MKCQILFSRKNKENVISLLSAGFAHSMVSVIVLMTELLPLVMDATECRPSI